MRNLFLYSVLVNMVGVSALEKPSLRHGFGKREESSTHVTLNPLVATACRVADKRETCSAIFLGAVGAPGGSLRNDLEHYCREVPPLVACLEANKADYKLLLFNCGVLMDDPLMSLRQIMSPDKIWNMVIKFLETVNNIICSRTDEVVDLIECVDENDDALVELLRTCATKNSSPVTASLIHSEIRTSFEPSVYCGATFDFETCMRDGMRSVCPGTSDLLDSIYDDVVVGVIEKAMTCEEEAPLSYQRNFEDAFTRLG